jgi:glutaredoxin
MTIEIYGKPDCIYCTKAKNLLDSRGIEYKYYSLGEDYTLDEFKEKFPGRKSVPQIILDGVLLDDGYTSLAEVVDNFTGGFGDDFS